MNRCSHETDIENRFEETVEAERSKPSHMELDELHGLNQSMDEDSSKFNGQHGAGVSIVLQRSNDAQEASGGM